MDSKVRLKVRNAGPYFWGPSAVFVALVARNLVEFDISDLHQYLYFCYFFGEI